MKPTQKRETIIWVWGLRFNEKILELPRNRKRKIARYYLRFNCKINVAVIYEMLIKRQARVVTLEEMTVRLKRLTTMRAAHAHALSETPEEDANRKIMDWAKRNRAVMKGTRLFGRNTYPTDNPEPHGYEFFLTIEPDVKPEGDIDIREIHGGLYATLRFTNLEKIGEAWQKLWKWFEENKREHVGFKKEEHGWVDGYEEHLNWKENKPPNDWIFDLWVQLKE